MSGARRLLIFGGLALAALGMAYGLHYAVFVEHQTLDSMGGSLAQGFVHAAERHMPEAQVAIAAYGSTKYDYVRQVDVHSHWIGLAMLLIVLGVLFDHLGFAERVRFLLALALLLGAIVFPLGVILQTASQGPLPRILAVVGTVLVTAALAVVALGFARPTTGA
jgi:hypothetical protein